MDFFSKLPRDIILNILSRNPMKTVVACKCVCKSWLILIETPDFARCHLPNSVPGILIHHVDTNYADTDVFNILELEDSREMRRRGRQLQRKCKNMSERSFASTTQIEGSSSGLVFVRDPYSHIDALFICNPITGECIGLPEPERIHENFTIASYGFGGSRISSEYKVVKFFHYRDRDPVLGPILKRVCQVYTLGEGSWRSTTVPCEMLLDCSCHSSGELLNGDLHWLARDSDGAWWISCFDLETEVVSEFRAPTVKSRADRLNVGVIGDRLCVCHNSSISEIHIYLMCTDDGGDKSWSKEYVISKIPIFVDKSFEGIGAVYVVKAFGNGDLLLARDNSFLFYYYNRTKTITAPLDGFIAEDAYSFKAMSYAPSFISLKDFATENVRVIELGFSNDFW